MAICKPSFHKIGSLTVRQTFQEGRTMLKLGFYTMLSGMVSTLTLVLMKRFILQAGDLEQVGLFQAVWSFSTIYLGALLSSMGADYYPKLCSLHPDKTAMNRFANEQILFVVLVATPLIVTVLWLAPPVLNLFFSSRFLDAAPLLRWQILGTGLKVLIWPIGFYLLAFERGSLFFTVELIWNALFYGLSSWWWPRFGLEATGLAFVAAYLLYCPLVYWIVRPLAAFRFTGKNRITGGIALGLTVLMFGLTMYGDRNWLF